MAKLIFQPSVAAPMPLNLKLANITVMSWIPKETSVYAIRNYVNFPNIALAIWFTFGGALMIQIQKSVLTLEQVLPTMPEPVAFFQALLNVAVHVEKENWMIQNQIAPSWKRVPCFDVLKDIRHQDVVVGVLHQNVSRPVKWYFHQINPHHSRQRMM